jgi:hypothetical protein
MPNYHFHIDGGDAEGVELPDDITARTSARETFGEMIREGAVEMKACMEVVDESGRRILMLKFSSE